MHLFSTVMHCGASFLDCDALYNNTPRDKSELRCQPGLQCFTSCCRAAVRAQCNGHCTAEKKLVQWCTMCNGAQCSAVLYSAHTRCGMCGAAHTQLTPQPALRCMHYILQGLKFQLREHWGFICSHMHSDCSAIKVLAVHSCVMLTAMHT